MCNLHLRDGNAQNQAHQGTADHGHYYSLIRTDGDRWLEFNDRRVTPYDPANIPRDCFGGAVAPDVRARGSDFARFFLVSFLLFLFSFLFSLVSVPLYLVYSLFSLFSWSLVFMCLCRVCMCLRFFHAHKFHSVRPREEAL